ncbi:cfem domain-containing [Trichoderma cornu-damae]|uniref:Cfem domain-containing n=1 Tax=Trichoderma cornu-damae TaxID=654480 RepID=A0A9P8QFZ1_9HYPO|nr:cfem domain-containing [Trichoderma cornu-damae]
MKASVVSLLLAGLVAAQDFAGQPQCAIPCLEDAIPKAGCALTDTACACKPDVQAKLLTLVGPCLIRKCSPADLGQAQAAAADACKKLAASASSSPQSVVEHSTEAATTAPGSSTTAPGSSTTAATGSTTAESATTRSTTAESTTAESTTAESTTVAAESTTAKATPSETKPSNIASNGATIPTGPSGVSNSTVSGSRSVVTRTSTALVDAGEGNPTSSGAPASTTLAGDAAGPVAGVLGAVLAALMAL